mgnify:CR=1 FL=1
MRTIDAIQAVNDATALAAVLMPLIQGAVASRVDEISDEEVDAARAKLERNIAALDSLIAELRDGGPAAP